MATDETNTCDCCDAELSTYELVWITSEDFEPKEDELLMPVVYEEFDALCEER